MTLVPAAARATAEGTLTAACTVTRPGVDSVHATTGAITAGAPTTVWAGACSISPQSASPSRTGTLGDDRLTGTHVARIPAEAGTRSTTAGNPRMIRPGDTLTTGGDTYIVKAILDRTTEVLRRLSLDAYVDAEQVPR